METCSSIPHWEIPWTEEPGGLQSTGPLRVTRNWVTKHTWGEYLLLTSTKASTHVREDNSCEDSDLTWGLEFWRKIVTCHQLRFRLLFFMAVVHGLSLVAGSRGYSLQALRASHCSGSSCCRARALGTWVSVAVAHGLSSYGSRAQLPWGRWDLPEPGIKPISPALAGRFLPSVVPGKSVSLLTGCVTNYI